MAWSNFTSGEVVTATRMNQLYVDWQDYTPSLTASTTDPTLNGTAAGRYCKMGRTVIGWALIQFGSSGINAGSGSYRVSLPDTAAAVTYTTHVGGATLYDNSSGTWDQAEAYLRPTTGTTNMQFTYEATSLVNNTGPWTWNTSDYISVSFKYESSTP